MPRFKRMPMRLRRSSSTASLVERRSASWGICKSTRHGSSSYASRPTSDLAEMLVHRRARRSGLGRALFDEVEREAIARGKTLLTFDTVTGGPAERMYVRCGCVKVGEIPGYALFPDGVPVATSVFYKELRIGLTNRHR